MAISQQLIIISGGQTGVDRAALDFAIRHHIPCEGWCPKGRKAEDGIIPIHYPLKEMHTASYADRTRQNILDSDATLILIQDLMDPGTKLTHKLCKDLKKQVHFQVLEDQRAVANTLKWIILTQARRLNVAGPRESLAPGIYFKALQFFEKLSLEF